MTSWSKFWAFIEIFLPVKSVQTKFSLSKNNKAAAISQ